MLKGLGRKLLNEKPVYVIDATPLIHFAKINKLDLILDICRAYIAEEVHRKVVTRAKGRPDVALVADAVNKGRLKVYKVRDVRAVKALLTHPEIHRGEAETIAAAQELHGTAVMDDAEGRVVAGTYGVKVATGTLFLLFRLAALRKVGRRKANELLEELVNAGLHLDVETLLRAKRRLSERA